MDSEPPACCVGMALQRKSCDDHGLDCPDVVIRFNKIAGYGIKIPASVGGGFYLIKFCPWCGKKLDE